jgi:hypothetical protein
MWWSLTVHGRQYNRAHVHCMLRNQGYRHTLRICNTYCLSTATMFTLYVYCLSCHHSHAIFVSSSAHGPHSYALIRGLPLSKVKTVMFYGRTPSLPFFLYALLIIILTRTDLGHSHIPNSIVLQYTHCADTHARLHHGADYGNDFRWTIAWNFIFCCYNSNKRTHTILLKSQYCKTPLVHCQGAYIATFV